MQHPENRLWELLALKLAGEATPDDLCELEAYLRIFPDEKYIVNNIEVYWYQKNDLGTNNEEMEEERFHLILNAESQDEIKNDGGHIVPVIKSIKLGKYKWFYAAASVIIIFGFSLLFKRRTGIDLDSSSKTNIQQIFVKPGSKSKIVLPDGTVVRLNGSSKLSYHKSFNEKIREVELEGEAYFDVTKDAKRPFIVHTSNIDVMVLGTLFNVKSYEEDQTIEATLLRGSIEVYNKNDPSAPKVILKPNEKLIFRKKEAKKISGQDIIDVNSSIRVIPDENISISTLSGDKPDSIKEETSWLYNKLVIDGDDFKKMADKMERWYGVEIEILSPALEQYHFKGIFENETIAQALDALQLTVKFRYKINNNIIKIME
jgi:ferric-dicitrate binding protein FerR (iron transport regulator)